MLFLKRQCFGDRLNKISESIRKSSRVKTYRPKGWHLGKSYVLRSTNERLLRSRKGSTLKVCVTYVAIDENVAFAETGLAAAVEVFVAVCELVEIGGGLGAL